MIQHVTREVTPLALEECVRFYGVLGFRPVQVPAGITGRALWVEREGTQIHLMPREDAEIQSGHVGIVVERYEGTIERLRAGGLEIDPRTAHWGSPRAYVRDPAGHLVELMAFAPGGDTAGRRPPESAGRASSA